MSQSEGVQGEPPAEMQVAQLSDTGRARPHNEDYVDYYVPRDPQELTTKGGLYLVADGMGGHQAGEVASRAAVERVIDLYYRDVEHDVGTSLVRAIRAANRAVYEQAQADASKGGMGTTLVAAVVVGAKVYVASVGDSRAYLIGPGHISQITEDHSWVQEQVRAGLLTPEQARQHPQRNVVTRALGSKPAVEVDLFEGQIGEGDALLLCSDGLSGLVEDRELQSVVASQPPAEAVRTLVALANERGGTDNITVLIINNRPDLTPAAAPSAALLAASASSAAPAGAGRHKPRARRVPWLPILAGVAALLALLAAGVFVILPLLKGTAATATHTPTAPLPTGTGIQSPLATPVLPATLDLGSTLVPVAITQSPTVTLIPSRTPTAAATSRPTRAQATASSPAATGQVVQPTESPQTFPLPALPSLTRTPPTRTP
jgi:serine/threonine protein phosphatase PrpC